GHQAGTPAPQALNVQRAGLGRAHIGIYPLKNRPFPAILRQRPTAGVSLTVGLFLVLQKNPGF
ncbi:MAG: hypothetical protein ACI4O3_01815, partial [Oscillospiraceae bacterium]